jgi:hypothetical protein
MILTISGNWSAAATSNRTALAPRSIACSTGFSRGREAVAIGVTGWTDIVG